MSVSRDTDLVFGDLRDALAALEAARGSPKDVRRAFTTFVDLSQKLTSTMRTDYSRAKGGAWEAKSFTGWNPVTEFFKWLRNQDQHKHPIRIAVHERHFYEVPGQPGQLFPFEGTWMLDDQQTDTLPSGYTFHANDPKTGQTVGPVPPVRIEYQYLIQLTSDSLRQRLRAIGTTDMHQLSAACFATLSAYYDFFVAKVSE